MRWMQARFSFATESRKPLNAEALRSPHDPSREGESVHSIQELFSLRVRLLLDVQQRRDVGLLFMIGRCLKLLALVFGRANLNFLRGDQDVLEDHGPQLERERGKRDSWGSDRDDLLVLFLVSELDMNWMVNIPTSRMGGAEPYRSGREVASMVAPKVGGADWQRSMRCSDGSMIAIVLGSGVLPSFT